MTEAAVQVDEVTKRFGTVAALNSLSIKIDRGVTFGLLGPNGSGKTTLIRALVGLLRPDGGRIAVLGEDPASAHLKQRVGYMTQQPALYTELTVRENLDFFARVYGLDRADRRVRIDELVSLVELKAKADSPVSTLSGGMVQRLSLACALVHRPDVVFLDEPTVGIDPALRRAFWSHFKTLNQAGVTIVVSSHVMDEAARCDRLGLLLNGRLLAEGNLNDLLVQSGRDNLEDVFLHLAGGHHV